MKLGQYCQRQRCKHVELEQFMACFRVARVCQRQQGFLVGSLLVVHCNINNAISLSTSLTKYFSKHKSAIFFDIRVQLSPGLSP